MRYFYLILFSFLLSNENILSSGPMVGYSEKMEVALWVQTTKEAEVNFLYWDINNPDNIYKTNNVITTKP